MRRQLLGLGFAAASSLLALHTAHALTGPQPITIDGGPLGQFQLSGGVDGYGYVQSNTSSNIQSNGFNVGNALIDFQKTTGVLQFTIEIGSSSTQTLGAETYDSKGHIHNTSVDYYSTGPLFEGYVTIAPPNSPVTVSAGMLPSLEGYESTVDWNNPVQLTTLLFYVQNSNARGVQANLTEGPFSASVQFGDGTDSGVWNTIQALVSYKINDNNVINIYGADNLGRTGANTFAYGYGGNSKTGWGNAYANATMIGAYYNFTHGNLSVVPEVQYTYARRDRLAGIIGSSNNIGAAVFADYAFANTPYSLGGWVEYFNSHSATNSAYDPSTGTPSSYSWAIGPNAEAIGVALAPTWQYKNLFARANAGYIYLLRNKGGDGSKYGYGNNNSHGQFTGTLEAGLLF